jgi:hypothetical protein
MKKRVLISGCSFTENFIQFDPMHWTYNAFPQDVYVVNNVARGAAGNNYIASSILSNIDLNSKPDYVFILWSGIRRIDMPFPSGTSTTKFKNYLFCAVNNECQFVDYFFTGQNIAMLEGGSRRHFDVESSIFEELADIYYDNEVSDNFCNQLSLSAISSVTNFLDNHNINYNFSFIYGIHNKHLGRQPSLGPIDTKNKQYDHINWDRYIDIPPFDYGIKHNLISADRFHLTDDGMRRWASLITKEMNL